MERKCQRVRAPQIKIIQLDWICFIKKEKQESSFNLKRAFPPNALSLSEQVMSGIFVLKLPDERSRFYVKFSTSVSDTLNMLCQKCIFLMVLSGYPGCLSS